MKVICDCGTEMEPVVDSTGAPEVWYPVVTLYYMGKAAFEGRGFYYDCPKCKVAVTLNYR